MCHWKTSQSFAASPFIAKISIQKKGTGPPGKLQVTSKNVFQKTMGDNNNILYSSQREIKAVVRSYTLTHNEE